jgi:hypothetical protein
MPFISVRKAKQRFSNIHKANNAVNAEQDSVHRLADRVEPDYKREFIMAVASGEDSINRAALNRAIENADVEASLTALGIEQFAVRTAGLGVLFSDITRRGAKNAERFLKPNIQRRFSFDPFSEVAARITRERSAALVANVTDETRLALETVLANARRQGLPTPQTGRLAANVLGLNQKQAIALSNLRFNLAEQGFKQEVIESRIREQSTRFLAQRAQTIARTESTAALNQARNLVWGQLQEQGLVEPVAEKQWITARDERVCFTKNTMITTPCGKRPIQNIKSGDKVRTRNGLQKVIQTSKKTLLKQFTFISAISSKGKGHHIFSTSDHPVFVNGEWREASQVIPGEKLVNVEGKKLKVIASITPNESVVATVYNLQVEDDPVYYANGILVHNCPICGPLDNETVPLTETFSSEVGALDSPPAHPNCFPADTMITMSSGKEKRIAEIIKGDLVKTETGINKVIGLSKRPYCGPVTFISTDKGTLILCTENHPFKDLASGQWVEAHKLQVGHKLGTFGGDSVILTVLNIIGEERCEHNPLWFYDSGGIDDYIQRSIFNILEGDHIDVYNFEVENDPSYYANGVLAHNCRCTITLRSDGTTGRRPAWKPEDQPEWKRREATRLFLP